MPAHSTLDLTLSSLGTRSTARGAAAPLIRRVPNYEPAPESGRPPAPARAGTGTRPPAAVPRRPVRPDPVVPAALVRAQQVFRVTFEVLEGRRGPHQLRSLMSPDVVAKVTTLARVSVGQRRSPGTARLHRVHVQQITSRAVEACVSVERGGKVHAVAARLELAGTGWCCTTLVFG